MTRKDKNHSGTFIPEEKSAFDNLKPLLCSEQVMSYPRAERTYSLIVDDAISTSEKAVGIAAILTQINKSGSFHTISYAPRQLVTQK